MHRSPSTSVPLGAQAVSAVAAHIRERGPQPGCRHIVEQLIALDDAFPDLSFRDFVVAFMRAATEGEA